MARVLLLLPTGTYRAGGFVEAAQAMGVEVVVGSERRQALAGAMGDRAVVVSLSDPELGAGAIVDLARRAPLDAVVAVDDQGVVVAAMAGQRLGLPPHNPPQAVALTRDKAAMRAALSKDGGVPQPPWRVVAPGEDAGAAAAQVGFPCVVKPTILSASRGVIRADDPEGARTAAARAGAVLAEANGPGCGPGPLVVERFVPGREVALEGLLRGGCLEVLALFDKPDPLDGPFFEETIYVTPSRLAGPAQAEVARVTARACTALGLAEGPVHAELRVQSDGAPEEGGVWVLEVAARSIGGLCSRSLSFGTGLSLEHVILAHALGRPLPDLAREGRASGVMMLPIPSAGVLEEVGGQAAARAVPGVTGLEISILPGRPVRPLPEGDRYLGFLFAKAERPEDVESALRAAHAALDIRIHPDRPRPGEGRPVRRTSHRTSRTSSGDV